MKSELILYAALTLPFAACDQGDTDVGDLPGGSGGQTSSGSASGGQTEPTTTGVDCPGEGENCEAGCCEGFACNFANECEACTPAGEFRSVDGAGCCPGLDVTPGLLCYASECPGGECPEGGEFVTCSSLDPSTGDGGIAEYVADCAPEACLESRTLVARNEAGQPGLECSGPGGGNDCAAEGLFEQHFAFSESGLLMTVSFGAEINDAGYSTAAFNEHFVRVAGQLTVQNATVPVITFLETGTPSDMVYADGRLQFTIALQLDNPFDQIESDADDCISDDIAGICSCFYEDLGTYEVVVDLEVEGS